MIDFRHLNKAPTFFYSDRIVSGALHCNTSTVQRQWQLYFRCPS